jgi:Cys-tRNA(Pro)/Cys-tRNA(Cys) deacylase
MMPESTPVTLALDALEVPYRTFTHPGPVESLEQAARERGQTPDQVVRSIVFRIGKDDYIMVLIAGARQVSWPGLRKHLGQSRLTMANETELRSVTGYEVGAVSPFGLPGPMRILVDQGVFAPQEVSIGSGVRGVAVILHPDDLKRALGEADIGSFAQG